MRMKISWLISVLGAAALCGCNTGVPSTGTTNNNYSPTATPGDTKTKPTGKLEVVAFKGGYGTDFYEKCAKDFETLNPGLSIDVSGDPRVWEKLRPRMVAGTPPDLMFPGWGMDHWALAEEDQLLDLTPFLNETAPGTNDPWGQTFDPNVLKLGQLDGKQYVLPYYVMLQGWWYDPGVFAKNGWTPPKTTKELMDLCARIKAKGIAPITYQGKYPYYMVEGMLLPWCHSIGGSQAVKDAQNLVPGAWKSPAMLQAATMIADLNSKGYFEQGATAMSHTESQTEFLQGRAAMIPCGTWLYSEMKSTMPKGAKMEFFKIPVVDGGKGDPTTMEIGIEPWMVPKGAKNPRAAIDFFKYMTSLPKAREFVQEKGTLMSIKGSDQIDLPEVLKAPAAAFKAAKEVWAVQYRQWYPAFQTEIENALTTMLNGQLTPQQFCDRVETAAERTRNDKSVTKHKLS